ncbi:MAG: type II toxin-antitoxin system RelE/ParE family toxin [Candidatus Dadabacteria bacterium]|nr:type II toxin-antitoxin system RelE/ParE family toxin [Candidatus Dadabacteria bacterium]
MWKVEFSEKAAKQFAKLPRNIQQSVVKAIEEKLLVDPDFYLSRLSGHMGNFYRFRVGNYRLLCLKRDEEIFIIAVGHRKDIYKSMSTIVASQ